jgi:hypothetical protein
MVCADVEVAAAARTRDVESFIIKVDIVLVGVLGLSSML